jgi:glycosyltransferase involved in cell wall biosynthesis
MNHELGRLAFVIPSFGDGGSNRFIMKIADGMADRGFSVDLIAIDPRGQYSEVASSGVRRIGIGVLPIKGVTVLKTIWFLTNYVRRERPKALMAATSAVNVISLISNFIARRQTSVVVSERNAIRSSAVNASRMSRFYRMLIPHIYPTAARIVAVSKGVEHELVNSFGIDPSLVTTIHNPTVSPDLIIKKEDRTDEPWLYDSRVPVILAVGRLHPQKDYSTLVEGFARFRKRRKARLIILGEGPCRQELHELVGSLGLQESVRLPGFIDNPYAYMSRADIFVVTSIYEGICNVLIEALACGCATVATDCPGGGPREVLENGKWGTLIPVGDSKRLADALEASLNRNHDSKELQQRAACFSVESSLDRYQDIFSAL